MSKSPITTAAKKNNDENPASVARMRRAPTHPGEIFRDIREAQDPRISTRAAAQRMGISNNRLNEIELGQRSVTPETAVLFQAMTGASAEFWATLQMRFDVWHALQAAKKIKRLLPGAPFPTSAATE